MRGMWLAPLLLLVAACVTPQVYVTSIGPLRVDYEPDVTIFNPDITPEGQPGGSTPIQGGIGVRTLNGRALPFEARQAALEALEAHCRAQVIPTVPLFFGWREVADEGIWSSAGCA